MSAQRSCARALGREQPIREPSGDDPAIIQRFMSALAHPLTRRLG
jgi:hypothetical protein